MKTTKTSNELMQQSFSFKYWGLYNFIFFLQKLDSDPTIIRKAKSLKSIRDKLNKSLFRPKVILAHRKKDCRSGYKPGILKKKICHQYFGKADFGVQNK